MKKWEEQRKLLIHKKKVKAAKPIFKTTNAGTKLARKKTCGKSSNESPNRILVANTTSNTFGDGVKLSQRSKPNIGVAKKQNVTGLNFNPKEKKEELQGAALKQTFGTMDFSTRNKLNHQIIQNLNLNSEVTLSELSDQHVNKEDADKVMKKVFPPEEYGYSAITALEQLENRDSVTPPKDDYYNEVNALVSQYTSGKKYSARQTQNSFLAHLEEQKAQEQLARLQLEIEEDKRLQEEHLKLQEKVKIQRKKRRLSKKKEQEQKSKQQEAERSKAREARLRRIEETKKKTEERNK